MDPQFETFHPKKMVPNLKTRQGLDITKEKEPKMYNMLCNMLQLRYS